MPASPVIVSANVSDVKIDGEVVPGLQYIEYNIDGQKRTVNGTLKVRAVLPKLDSVIVNGQSKTHSFQVVVEIKRMGEQVYTLAFDECYFESTSFSMDANGIGVSEYRFTGSRIRDSRTNQETGISTSRPKINEVNQELQVKTPLTAPMAVNTPYRSVLTNIVKRDGQTQTFDQNKLVRSITRAGATPQQANLVSTRVVNRIGTQSSISSKELSSMTARSLSRVNTTASRNYAKYRKQKNRESRKLM